MCSSFPPTHTHMQAHTHMHTHTQTHTHTYNVHVHLCRHTHIDRFIPLMGGLKMTGTLSVRNWKSLLMPTSKGLPLLHQNTVQVMQQWKTAKTVGVASHTPNNPPLGYRPLIELYMYFATAGVHKPPCKDGNECLTAVCVTFHAVSINPIHPIGNSLKKQKPCTKV